MMSNIAFERDAPKAARPSTLRLDIVTFTGNTMTKPRVFIGSSSEALKVAEAIHQNLEHDCFCEIWTHGVFGVNKYPLDALLKQANNADYAIMVFHPDDLTTTRGKRRGSPRDNVIFELGLFIGKLGRNKTCFVIPRGVDVKIPSDIVGLTPAAYDPIDVPPHLSSTPI